MFSFNFYFQFSVSIFKFNYNFDFRFRVLIPICALRFQQRMWPRITRNWTLADWQLLTTSLTRIVYFWLDLQITNSTNPGKMVSGKMIPGKMVHEKWSPENWSPGNSETKNRGVGVEHRGDFVECWDVINLWKPSALSTNASKFDGIGKK